MSDTFARLLRRFRRAAGVSQEELAEYAGLSKDAISALERGTRRAPYRDTVESIADALHLDPPPRIQLEAAAARGRGRRPGNAPQDLPTFTSPTIGREAEIKQLLALLETERLVTITGTGGIGKTRIAIDVATQIAAETDECAWFVDLAAVRFGADVTSKVAMTIGARIAGSGAPAEELVAPLRTRPGLLILDNCEHLINDVASLAATIVRACPSITILATSRERIAVDGERVYRISPLEPAAALELFTIRAASLVSDFVLTAANEEIATEICRQVDGIPLALELAAARVPILGLGELRARLRGQLAVLAGGRRDAPTRQQTMRDTIAWSYALLDDRESALFRRLSLFAGGWTLDALEAVALGPPLDESSLTASFLSLLEKSLISVAFDDERTRYRLLEPVRAFARSELDAALEFTEFANRHAEWIGRLAPSLRDDITQFISEIDNVRAALEWTSLTGNARKAARIIGGLGGAWARVGLVAEGRRWCQTVLEKLDTDAPPELAVGVYRALIVTMGGKDEIPAILRAIPFAERSGDWNIVAVLTSRLALRHGERGRFEEAERAFERVWELRERLGLGTSSHWATILMHRASIYRRQGRLEEGDAAISESLTLSRRLGKTLHEMWSLLAAAEIAFARGDPQRAITIAGAALDLAQKNHHAIGEIASQGNIAGYFLALGDTVEAKKQACAAIAQGQHVEPRHTLSAVLHLSAAQAMEGEHQTAAVLKGYVDTVFAREELTLDPTEASSYGILRSALEQHLGAELIEAYAREGASLHSVELAQLTVSLPSNRVSASPSGQ